MKSVGKRHFPQGDAERRILLATQDDLGTPTRLGLPPGGARQDFSFASSRTRSLALSFFSPVGGVVGPCWSAYRSQADIGKSSRKRELQGHRGVAETPGQSAAGTLGRAIHIGHRLVQRMVGTSGVSPFRFRSEQHEATPPAQARRTGRAPRQLFAVGEKLFLVPLLSFLPERPPGAQQFALGV